MKEFRRLGRDAFLSKYRCRKDTHQFLIEGGLPYDAKAILRAAYQFLPTTAKPLKWNDFGSLRVDARRLLGTLGFELPSRRDALGALARERASSRLDIGNLYTRNHLRKLFSTRDATINTGVFRPAGFRSVFLFVTEKKTPDRTQFRDLLQEDTLRWQGQLSGRTDHLIAEHEQRDLELLLFYRREKYEYPDAAFRYEGMFRYVRRRGSGPTSFLLVRQSPKDFVDQAQLEAEAEQRFEFDPANAPDDRELAVRTIARRRGQRAFRQRLLRAYGHRCAITGCNHPEVLEAAHIHPHKDGNSDHVTNGLLLRADIHTLFDLRWIAIEASSRKLLIHPSLAATTYRSLAGKRVAFPRNPADRPSRKALEWHFAGSRLHPPVTGGRRPRAR